MPGAHTQRQVWTGRRGGRERSASVAATCALAQRPGCSSPLAGAPSSMLRGLLPARGTSSTTHERFEMESPCSSCSGALGIPGPDPQYLTPGRRHTRGGSPQCTTGSVCQGMGDHAPELCSGAPETQGSGGGRLREAAEGVEGEGARGQGPHGRPRAAGEAPTWAGLLPLSAARWVHAPHERPLLGPAIGRRMQAQGM